MLPDINLLPEKERTSSFLFIIFMISTALLFLVAGLFVYTYFQTKETLSVKEQAEEELALEKTRLENELSRLRSSDEEGLQQAVSFLEHVSHPTYVMIDELLYFLPDHGYMSDYEYNYDHIVVEAQFESLREASFYTEKLVHESIYLSDVEIDEVESFVIEEVENVSPYETIPRYNVTFTLALDVETLREEVRE